VRAEQFRDLERRISAGSADGAAILAKTADQFAARSAALDATLQGLRRDFAALTERIAAQTSAAAPVVTEALEQLREHASTSAAHTAEVHADISTKLEQTTAELRREIVALNTRGTETAERQHEAVRVLGDMIAKSSTAQSDSLQSTFNQALERALDKIERTMQSATARPIEMTGEATEVLLSKIFDDPTNELTSNYDQLDVQQRKSTGSIAKSVGRLKEMGGSKTNSKEQPA
jgi:flagellar hook-basal body complex protein FliE